MGYSRASSWLVLLLLATSWPASAEQAPVAAWFEDAEGDAREYDSHSAPDAVTDLVGVSWREAEPGVPRVGGVPAPPHFDILGVDVLDSAAYLTVRMRLAAVPASWDEAIPVDEGARYLVCWQWGGRTCVEGVTRDPRRMGEGVIDRAEYFLLDEACAPRTCSWSVEAITEPGTPGALAWRIPRDAMPARPEGETLLAGEARAGRLLRGATAVVPADDTSGGNGAAVGRPFMLYDLDVAGATQARDLLSAPGEYRPEAFRRIVAEPGLVLGETQAELDLLGLDLAETATHLTVSLVVAQVEDAPRDHVAAFRLAFQRGSYVFGTVTARTDTSERRLDLTLCSRTDTVSTCSSGPLEGTLDVVQGSPGYLHVTFSKEAAKVPTTDARVGVFDASIRGVRATTPLLVAQPAYADPYLDATPKAPPFALRHPPEAAAEDGITLVDEVADVREGTPDLLGADLRQLTDGRVEATLRAFPLPTEGALFAAAMLETAAGPRMIGARVEAGRASFFCGPDTLVSPREPVAPASMRDDVVGAVTDGRPAVLVIEAPAECFGLPPGVPVRADRAGAALLTAGPDGALVLADLHLELGVFTLAPTGARAAAPAPGGLHPLLLAVPLVLLGALVAVAALLHRARRAHADAAPAVGHVFLRRYRIERALGEGGSGSAWLAYDRRDKRRVVVKLAHPGAGADALERFRKEAALLSRVAHPHVTRLLRTEEAGGRVYIVMEHVPGGTLAGAIVRGLHADAAARILLDVLEGLAHVHAQGILHRDVKPENVLLTADGRAKLADFGAARDELTPPTIQAGPVGTPQFLAPELLRGEPADVRSDIYAAGVTARLALAPRAIGSAAARYDAWLAQATARDPAKRFGSADEMRQDLLRIVLASEGAPHAAADA